MMLWSVLGVVMSSIWAIIPLHTEAALISPHLRNEDQENSQPLLAGKCIMKFMFHRPIVVRNKLRARGQALYHINTAVLPL